jgi:polyhydroxyalkanoate synthesis regulator protein
MPELTKEEMREKLGNIDQIRDILFGSLFREYGSRFEKIESDIALLQQEMHDYASQVKSVLSTELRAAIESFEKRLKSLSLSSQEETADLRQQVDRVNRKFTTTIESLDESVDKQINLMREEFYNSRERLQEDVRSLRNQVFDELNNRLSVMRDAKVSRDDMAEILFELGMKLKGTEFVPELKQAADTNLYTDVRLIESPNEGFNDTL